MTLETLISNFSEYQNISNLTHLFLARATDESLLGEEDLALAMTLVDDLQDQPQQ